MIYLDASAFFKLIVTEAETARLKRWLAGRAELPLVSSAIVRAEVPRAVWRADAGAIPRSYQLVRRITKVRVTNDILDTAASLYPPTLRTLDAIHLASALAVGKDRITFVAYDKRLLGAAKDAGLQTASPA